MGKRIDLTNNRFGCLTVVEKATTKRLASGAVKGIWKVLCDCGKTSEKNVQSIRKGRYLSCGDGCLFKWGVIKTVSCKKCGKEYQAKHRGSEEKLNRICRQCVAQNGSEKSKNKLAHNRLPDGQAAFNSLIGSYRRNASSNGKKFELTQEEFKSLTSSNCYYCDCEPSKIRESDSFRNKGVSSGVYVYNGLDKLDPDGDYVLSNVVPCCWACNMMKSNKKFDDFLEHIGKIHKNIQSKQRVFKP